MEKSTKKTFGELEKIQKNFMNDFDVMKYANGCGIWYPAKSNEIGLTLMFENEEQMNEFPYKEDYYAEVLIYKNIRGIGRLL